VEELLLVHGVIVSYGAMRKGLSPQSTRRGATLPPPAPPVQAALHLAPCVPVGLSHRVAVRPSPRARGGQRQGRWGLHGVRSWRG
jgi:hypothetical protein